VVVSTAEPNEGVRRDERVHNVQRVEDSTFHLG